MPRSRVLSFMSQWSAPKSSSTETESTSKNRKLSNIDTSSDSVGNAQSFSPTDSPSPTTQQRFPSDSRSASRSARPMSMIQTYQPPLMDVAGDTLPELQPVFTFLNSHSNKLYQEGYFLKLHDLDSRGRPSLDRAWNECFAQLVGTVLSLWDAAALDLAGEDGEVVPTFINLSDASVKMIESLPMSGTAGGSLQNVLSISTAANNRYLLHFNSLNSLTQWTAGIRLAVYEQATLQEAYTGSLIAGKGKMLNNIRTIMERSKFNTEDWVRVRFGAGTPWRRCWCVVSPPDEKEYHKAEKKLKKRDAYDRKIVIPKGNVKFYETRKVTKKTRPVATITDAYAAYAIYPQSKPLIDQSTLLKIEGAITIHGKPETTTEGFVFVMPEAHPAVTGFEMMLRFLFPVFDTFALYGRPNRLIADTLDQRGLMFAMPRNRRWGYLDILDVSGLIHTEGSQNWTGRQWRVELKKLTSHRMNSIDTGASPRKSMTSRTSLNLGRPNVRFGEEGATNSTPSTRTGSPEPPSDGRLAYGPPRRTSDAPPASSPSPGRTHYRSASDAVGYRRFVETPSRLSSEAYSRVDEEYDDLPPRPPMHGVIIPEQNGSNALERVVSESEPEPEPYDDQALPSTFEELSLQAAAPAPTPVSLPPKFEHNANSKPTRIPLPPPAALIRANSAMDAETLQTLAAATGKTPQIEKAEEDARNGVREVVNAANYHHQRLPADDYLRNEGLVGRPGYNTMNPQYSPIAPSPYGPPMQSSSYGEMKPPPVPVHRSSPDRNGSPTRPLLGRPVSSQSISRKPVPSRMTSPAPAPVLGGPTSRASNGSLRSEPVDYTLAERTLQRSPQRSLPISPERALQYSPDRHSRPSSRGGYASTDHASMKSASPERRDVDKPRTGRLKTVGDESLGRPGPYTSDNSTRMQSDGLNIDFGPALGYKPNANGMAQRGVTGDRSGPEHDAAAMSSSARAGFRTGIVDSQRNPYGQAREEADRRGVAWQPTGTAGDGRGGASVSAERWVQERASMASQPTMQGPPHLRSRGTSSDNALRSNTRTPPPHRPGSIDWTQQVGPRPQSQPMYNRSTGSGGNVLQAQQQAQAPAYQYPQQQQQQQQQMGYMYGQAGQMQANEGQQYGQNRAGQQQQGYGGMHNYGQADARYQQRRPQ